MKKERVSLVVDEEGKKYITGQPGTCGWGDVFADILEAPTEEDRLRLRQEGYVTVGEAFPTETFEEGVADIYFCQPDGYEPIPE